MTSPEATEVVRHRDFSLSPEPITFTIHPDMFECVSEIPLDVLGEIANAASTRGTGSVTQQLERMKDLFDGVMLPNSAYRFRQRLTRGTDEHPNPNPIGMRHIRDILPWLMEVYGLRPTQPSANSSAGSLTSEESSTDTASSTE